MNPSTTMLAGLGVAAVGAVVCCAAPSAPAAAAPSSSSSSSAAPAAEPAAAPVPKKKRTKPVGAWSIEPEPEPEPVMEADVSNLPPVEFIPTAGCDPAAFAGTTLLMVRRAISTSRSLSNFPSPTGDTQEEKLATSRPDTCSLRPAPCALLLAPSDFTRVDLAC